MTAILVELLVGLYFIGVSIPGMLVTPVSRPTLVQFIFGVVLLVLAVLGVSITH